MSFGHLRVLYVNFSVKFLEFAPKWSLFYLSPILAVIFVIIVVTIAAVNVKLISDFYTWTIVLIN